VERAVTADDDEQLRAVVDRLARELGELARRLGEERVADEPLVGGDVRQLRPALSRRPVGRRRVDEEDRLAQCAPIAVRSASCVI
jgi:hypothetical protein